MLGVIVEKEKCQYYVIWAQLSFLVLNCMWGWCWTKNYIVLARAVYQMCDRRVVISVSSSSTHAKVPRQHGSLREM